MSDAELIEQFRQGDVGAFNRLVRRRHQRRQTFSLNHGQDGEASTTQNNPTMEKHPRTDPELAAQQRDLQGLLNRVLQQLPEDVIDLLGDYEAGDKVQLTYLAG